MAKMNDEDRHRWTYMSANRHQTWSEQHQKCFREYTLARARKIGAGKHSEDVSHIACEKMFSSEWWDNPEYSQGNPWKFKKYVKEAVFTAMVDVFKKEGRPSEDSRTEESNTPNLDDIVLVSGVRKRLHRILAEFIQKLTEGELAAYRTLMDHTLSAVCPEEGQEEADERLIDFLGLLCGNEPPRDVIKAHSDATPGLTREAAKKAFQRMRDKFKPFISCFEDLRSP